MSFRIFTSALFEKELKALHKKYPSIREDVNKLGQDLLLNPKQGAPLGKDCFKIRLPVSSKGKGKSGGARIITCVKVLPERIYLLSIYDKSEKEDISTKAIQIILSSLDIDS